MSAAKVISVSANDDIKKEEIELNKEEVAASLTEELEEKEDWLDKEPLKKRIWIQFLRLYVTFLALYFFLVSLSLMGDGISALTGKSTGELFGFVNNPIVGLMVGITATVLFQSSSTTTSIIVVLVGNGVISVSDAVPIIMGSNIGTSVTSTIVSIGFIENPEAYERGFSGATVHDMFNYLNVLVFLPLEILISWFNGNDGGLLQVLAEQVTKNFDSEARDDDFSDANPIKKITNPILDALIQIDKDVLSDHAQFPEISLSDGEICDQTASEFTFSFESQTVEFVNDNDGCIDFSCNFCPNGTFILNVYETVQQGLDEQKLIEDGGLESLGDVGGGIMALIISFILLMGSLALIVKMLTALAQGAAQKVLVKSLNHNYPGGNYVSILIGCALTVAVQSSSITTSILTPLVAVDALSVESMFPYTLGANIGTTGTGLIAASADGNRDGFTIAFVHFFFNVLGTLVWYPIPKLRIIPINMAKFLGSMAAIWKLVPFIYIALAFFVYPLTILGISTGLTSKNGGGITVAVLFLLVIVAAHIYAIHFYRNKDGKEKFIAFVEARKARLEAKKQETLQQSKEKTIDELEP